MTEEVQLTIREATSEDAAQLLEVMGVINSQTEFLAEDEVGMGLPVELLENQLQLLHENPTNLLLVALDGEKIVGTASIRSHDEKRIAHIGEVGISILRQYWHIGLGSVLMEELLAWAKETKVLRRLELTVQKQNIAAIALYQKFSFKTEATMERGARGDDGRFLTCLLMSRMID